MEPSLRAIKVESGRIPGADGEIDFVLDQIERLGGEAQLDPGFRMGGEKIEHRAGQEIIGQAHGSRNANRARRLHSRFREPSICIINCAQSLAGLLIIEAPCVRHVEAA